jgi:hypothetical protein
MSPSKWPSSSGCVKRADVRISTMALLTMTIFSTALAAVTSIVAWRVIRRETRRSDARVAALATAIHRPEAAFSSETVAGIASFPSEHLTDVALATPAPSLNSHRLLATLSAGALVVAGLLIVAAQRGGYVHHNHTAAVADMNAARQPSKPSSAAAAAAAPLELIALSHERGKDTLVVRGAIRNPSNGTTCEIPAVVVLTFDEHGIFLGSNESDGSGETLPPGARATFSVTVPAGTTPPARYKVSFRSGGRVLPHVDKRVPADAATAGTHSAPGVRLASPEQS